MANVRIRHRSATATEWFNANPILSVREIAYEHPDTGVGTGPVKSKQGDGVTPWNNLPYISSGGGGSDSNEVILTETKTTKIYIAGTSKNITNTGTMVFNNSFYIDELEGLKADKITTTVEDSTTNGITIINNSSKEAINIDNGMNATGIKIDNDKTAISIINNQIDQQSIGIYCENNNSYGKALFIPDNLGIGFLIGSNKLNGIVINDNYGQGIYISNNTQSTSACAIRLESKENTLLHLIGTNNGMYNPAIKVEGGIECFLNAPFSKAVMSNLTINRVGRFADGININGGPDGNCIALASYSPNNIGINIQSGGGNAININSSVSPNDILINHIGEGNAIHIYHNTSSTAIDIKNDSYGNAINIENIYSGTGINITNTNADQAMFIDNIEGYGIKILHKCKNRQGMVIFNEVDDGSSDCLYLVPSTGAGLCVLVQENYTTVPSIGITIGVSGSEYNKAINIDNATSGGTAINVKSTYNSGRSIHLINESSGIAQLIENNDITGNSLYTTIGLSVVNKSAGHGIVITNQSNEGIGFNITNNGTNDAMVINNTAHGKGIRIYCTSISDVAIATNGISKLQTVQTDSIIFNNDLSSITRTATGIDINSNVSKSISFVNDCFSPKVDGTIDLGSTTLRWNNIYATSSTISTSDKNKKKNIKNVTAKSAKDIIKGLKPVSYEYKDGTSNRKHYGLIAQDVEDLLTKLNIDVKDFAALVKSPKYNEDGTIEGYDYGLRYEEFISILIKEIQNQNKEINDLKKDITSIKEFIKM